MSAPFMTSHSCYYNVICFLKLIFQPQYFSFRESFDKLSQMAQALNEEGHGAGREVRLASQHLTNYQNMVKTVKDKLRTCQLALQEHLTLEEALQSMWSWVKEVQDKLASSESTVGSKATLEKRLTQIQVKIKVESIHQLTLCEGHINGKEIILYFILHTVIKERNLNLK